MLFFPFTNVKMPTIVGILTFMSRKISYSVELSMKKSFITSGLVSLTSYFFLCSDITALVFFLRSLVGRRETKVVYWTSIYNLVVTFLSTRYQLVCHAENSS